jgi:HptB-dependent secretion and biofilm anti anti-sigma factor
MAVETHYDVAKATLTIKVAGRFDFAVHQDFRKAIEKITPAMKVIVIDFFVTEYMDSSALGMLLVLRDKVSTAQQTVQLVNTRPEVRKILDIAHFDKLFAVI